MSDIFDNDLDSDIEIDSDIEFGTVDADIVVRPIMENNKLKSDSIPWVEKYRPKKLDDIIQQEEVIKVLKKTVETGDMTHLLFFGPSGTGKTSTILATAMQLYGPDKISERVIELNASDDRGIGAVRNSIISFSKVAIGSSDPKYPCPPFKIVILDEADAMTPEAQAALRKVMETMSKITRFCFVCNYITQIIEPISSRCMKFRFKPVSNVSIIKRLNLIAKKENINIGQDGIDKIAEISEGDVRRSIMTLQNLKYLLKYHKTITPTDIISVTGGVDEKKISYVWKLCMTGSVIDMRNLAIKLCRNGYQVQSILNYLKTQTLISKLSDDAKSLIFIELAQTDKRLIESSDEWLQILNILCFINNVAKL